MILMMTMMMMMPCLNALLNLVRKGCFWLCSRNEDRCTAAEQSQAQYNDDDDDDDDGDDEDGDNDCGCGDYYNL